MSKGLGRTERAILTLLARRRGPDTAFGLAIDIELGLWNGEDRPLGFTPSVSSGRSVERALRSLERKGLAVRIRQPFQNYGERGRPPNGWLLPAEAAAWYARNRRAKAERDERAQPAAKGQKSGLSDDDLLKIAEKVRSMKVS